LYTTLNFRYPVFIVTWHLTFAVSPTFHCFLESIAISRDRPSEPAFYNALLISWTEPKTSTSLRTCLSAPFSPSVSCSARV
jgi:hypothetical protein